MAYLWWCNSGGQCGFVGVDWSTMAVLISMTAITILGDYSYPVSGYSQHISWSHKLFWTNYRYERDRTADTGLLCARMNSSESCVDDSRIPLPAIPLCDRPKVRGYSQDLGLNSYCFICNFISYLYADWLLFTLKRRTNSEAIYSHHVIQQQQGQPMIVLHEHIMALW